MNPLSSADTTTVRPRRRGRLDRCRGGRAARRASRGRCSSQFPGRARRRRRRLAHPRRARRCGSASPATRGSSAAEVAKGRSGSRSSTSSRPSTGCRRRSVATWTARKTWLVNARRGQGARRRWPRATPVATPASRCSPASTTRATRIGVILKADLPDDDLSVDTWSSVYHGADWHERETWEMFGIDFTDLAPEPHLPARASSRATRCARTSRCSPGGSSRGRASSTSSPCPAGDDDGDDGEGDGEAE